jgi:hypothetical protein
MVGRRSPCSFDFEDAQAFGLGFDEGVFDDFVDAAATGAALERGAQFSEGFGVSGGDDFDFAVFGVADPAFELEFAGFAMDEPAEAYALDSSAY